LAGLRQRVEAIRPTLAALHRLGARCGADGRTLRLAKGWVAIPIDCARLIGGADPLIANLGGTTQNRIQFPLYRPTNRSIGKANGSASLQH
jgi:hypothetical protein